MNPHRARLGPALGLSLAVALVLATVSGVALAQSSPARLGGEAAPVDLPVTRVVLFTTGVGYFEHAGIVDGTQEFELRVDNRHMDDLLASLVLEDRDGGSVTPVRYGARDPLDRILASYAIDLSRDPTLAQLLAQARGEALRVETDEVVEGVLVNVERVQTAEGGASTLLTLSTSSGVRRVALEEVRELRFENDALRSDLDDALAAIARARDADANAVRLRFEGEGQRRVRVGYVREMPVWKPSYRLVIGDDGRADLQGWAILDNPTHLDLVDVEVAFVAGRPISFVSELFEPVYVGRPRVGPSVAEPFVPPADGGAFARSASPAPMAESMDMADAMAAPPSLSGAGVEAMAEGVAAGTSFAYVVRGPVSVGRYESVMVPVLLAEVAAPRSSYHAAGFPGPSPLRAVRIVNDTGLHLAAGPVTLFDAGGFAGSATLGDLPDGEDRLLAYAVDLDVRIASETSAEPERVTRVALRGALLETVHRSRVRTTVRVTGGAEARFVVVELPRRPGFEVVTPEDAPVETADALRFGVAWAGGGGEPVGDDAVPTHLRCDPDAACRLEVVFERLESRTVALSNVEPDRIVLYLENVELSDDDRAVLTSVLEAQRRIASLARDAGLLRSRLDAVFRDQDRVRQNMAALDRTSSLYRRYLADLEAQEDEVAALGADIAAADDELRAAEGELEALLSGLVEPAID